MAAIGRRKRKAEVFRPWKRGITAVSNFAIKYPFFILMLCLVVMVVGAATVFRMPIDLFPQIQIPVVVVATFYSGMPPQQIEGDITDTFERFFTLGSNIDHIESRSLTGVSLIKVKKRSKVSVISPS